MRNRGSEDDLTKRGMKKEDQPPPPLTLYPVKFPFAVAGSIGFQAKDAEVPFFCSRRKPSTIDEGTPEENQLSSA